VWIRERQGSGVTSLKAMVNSLRSAWTARAIVSDDTPTPCIAATCARNARTAVS
jgi:hypothetical protein